MGEAHREVELTQQVTTQRDLSLDVLRFAAVCGVVLQHGLWVPAHAGEEPALAALGLTMWAVPLLFAVSGYLSTASGRALVLGRRMRRLLVPYGVWSLALLAYAAQGAIRAGRWSTTRPDWLGVVFAGEAFYTLWFLAMLAYVTLIGWALRSTRARVVVLCAALSAYVVLVIARAEQPVLPTDTWGGFAAVMPLCVASYLAGALLPGLVVQRWRGILSALAVLAVACDALMYVSWGTELTQSQQFAVMVTASVAALAALGLSVRAEPRAGLFGWAAWSGGFSLGVYAIHAPVLNMVRLATHTREHTSLLWAIVVSMVCVVVSLTVSYAMSRARWLRPLVC